MLGQYKPDQKPKLGVTCGAPAREAGFEERGRPHEVGRHDGASREPSDPHAVESLRWVFHSSPQRMVGYKRCKSETLGKCNRERAPQNGRNGQN
jgi:hypothetical protein